ncbi:MAG: hypothetical protein AAF665_15600 [Pseudomonadota bacterium]
MSDLFDSVSARFSPGSEPSITPRPQSRFESTTALEPMVEEEEIVAIRSPVKPANSAAAIDGQSSEPRTASEPVKNRGESPLASAETENAPNLPDRRQDEKITRTETTKFEIDDTTVSPRDTSTPRPEVLPTNTKVASKSDAVEPPQVAKPQHYTETPERKDRDASADSGSIEASTHVFETQLIEQPGEPRESSNTEVSQTTQTTVRIGRIEMRQPVPPDSAPKPPPPRRVTAPQSSTKSRAGSNGSSDSGLTGYLGWKRR